MKQLNSKKFYKRVAKETGWHFSKLNYEKEVISDFNYWETLQKIIDETKTVIDIGCGSAEKTIKLLTPKKIYCIDVEKEMLKKAKQNLLQYPKKADRFEFLKMNAFKKIDFPDESFDIAVSRHCGCNHKELYRILKKEGTFVSEDISKDDCQELKEMYGRGQGYEDKHCLSQTDLEDYTKLNFSKIQKYDITEIEYYKTKEDLLYLLFHTPIIPHFGKRKTDFEILDHYVALNTTPRGIKLIRKLHGFILEK